MRAVKVVWRLQRIVMAFAVVLLYGCTSNTYQTELQTLNVLNQRVDSAIEQWSQNGVAVLDTRLDSLELRINTANRALASNTDTVRFRDKLWLSRWAILRVNRSVIQSSAKALLSHLQKCSTQISALNHDLEYGLISQKQAAGYVKREKTRCQTVFKQGAKVDSMLSASYITYDQVKYFIDSLENNIEGRKNVTR